MQVYVLFEWKNDGWDHGYWDAVAVKTNFDDAEEWEKKNWDERKIEQFQLDVQ